MKSDEEKVRASGCESYVAKLTALCAVVNTEVCQQHSCKKYSAVAGKCSAAWLKAASNTMVVFGRSSRVCGNVE
jgi:hypothetical protein